MSASYPTSVKSFTALNQGDFVNDTDIEVAYDEITAVQQGLLNGLEHPVRLAAATEYTIASGVITVAKGFIKIDTEGDAAADDLATITAGTNVGEGSILICRAENTARVVTLKDGSGNLLLMGDCVLSTTDRTITLIYDGSNWREIARSAGSGGMPPLTFTALANQPPASSFATPDTRNSHPVLDFDHTSDEEAVFGGVLPTAYAGGGLTVDTYWAFTSATSGSLRVQAAFERIDASSLDIDSDSFAAFQSTGGTAPATSGQVIKVSIPFTDGAQMDSLAAGEAFRVKIRRDADGTSGTDDITTSDAELLRVVVREA